MKNSMLLLDPDFDPNTAQQCNLLLKITNDSFSYAIINQEHKQLKAVFDEQECDDMTQTLKHHLKNDPYLNYPFKEVKIAVSTPDCVTVPTALYQDTDLNAYSNFFAAKNSQRIYSKQNSHFDFTAVYQLQDILEQEIDQHFNNPEKFEQSLSHAKMAETIDHGLCLDFTARSFTAMWIKDGKLQFKNSFETVDAEEFNYYLLLMINKLGIAPDDTPVLMSGIVNEGDDRHQIVEKYFKASRFIQPLRQDLDCTILEDMPAYYYSHLLALDLCV